MADLQPSMTRAEGGPRTAMLDLADVATAFDQGDQSNTQSSQWPLSLQ